jgi:DNA repair exonuclease SbcCD ATPase subunit
MSHPREMTVEDFDEANEIKQQIKDLTDQKRKLERTIEEEWKHIKAREAAIQKKCKHWFVKFHPDPSGNNDSHEECQVCGKQAKSL